MNELERILGEVAEAASRGSGQLPLATLRARGVRRRRLRRAGYGAAGVAAVAGLALGANQLLPDSGLVAPAVSPSTTASPEPAPSTEPGRGEDTVVCGARLGSLPVVDSPHSLELSPPESSAARGAPLAGGVRLVNHEEREVTWAAATSAVVLLVRDDVVVGWSWREGPVPSLADVVELTGFGPARGCELGDLPGSPAQGEPLPAGEYEAVPALVTPVEAGVELVPGTGGSLAVTDQEPVVEVEVSLPACTEPVAGLTFPEGTLLADVPLEVVVGHTGEDHLGVTVFYDEGYGDQLRLTAGYRNRLEDWGTVREVEARFVVARDGVVVAEATVHDEATWHDWPRGEDRSLDQVWDWEDCATGEHTQVPKGEYEVLGYRVVEVERPDGTTARLTIGYEPVELLAYDYGDPDNPGQQS